MPHQQILRPRFYPIKNLEIFSTAELYAKAKYIDSGGNITENNVESDEETFKASIFNPYTRKRIPMVSQSGYEGDTVSADFLTALQ